MEPKLGAIAWELNVTSLGRGAVDYAHDFGRIYPVRVFMDFMGRPFQMLEQFLEWELPIFHSNNLDLAEGALGGILAYLCESSREQRAHPGPQLSGKLVGSQVVDPPIRDDGV